MLLFADTSYPVQRMIQKIVFTRRRDTGCEATVEGMEYGKGFIPSPLTRGLGEIKTIFSGILYAILYVFVRILVHSRS